MTSRRRRRRARLQHLHRAPQRRRPPRRTPGRGGAGQGARPATASSWSPAACPRSSARRLFERFPFVDIAIGPQHLHELPAALAAGGQRGLSSTATSRFRGELPAHRERPFQAWVQVMSGCSNFCSYCIVPHARGPERSRASGEHRRRGARAWSPTASLEVTLLGQNVNAYGADLTGSGDRVPTFARPAAPPRRGRRACARLRFTTSHPRDLSDDLVAAMAELPSVCEHLHLPAQSGSDRVLAAMGRGYTMEWYLGRVEACASRPYPRSRSRPTSWSASPARREADFDDTLAPRRGRRVRRRLHLRLLAPPWHGGGQSARPRAAGARARAHRAGSSRSPRAKRASAARRASARCVEVLVEGASRHGRPAAWTHTPERHRELHRRRPRPAQLVAGDDRRRDLDHATVAGSTPARRCTMHARLRLSSPAAC